MLLVVAIIVGWITLAVVLSLTLGRVVSTADAERHRMLSASEEALERVSNSSTATIRTLSRV